MRATLNQIFRYGIVGITSNLVGYFIYLGLVHVGLDPKVAMSILYGIGVAQTFILNKRWTFSHQKEYGTTLFRYCITYGLGYFINLAVLVIAVDHWGWQHQRVQGAMIICLAIFLFLVQKFWVFRTTSIGVRQ